MRKTEPKEIWIPFSDQDQKAKEAEMNALLDSGQFVYKDAKMFRDEQTGERRKFWVLWRKGPGPASRIKIAHRRFKGYKQNGDDEADIDVRCSVKDFNRVEPPHLLDDIPTLGCIQKSRNSV